MTAFIDQFGNLQISPNNGQATTPAQRSLVFDFSVPADPLNTYRPDVSGQTNFKILTNNVGLPEDSGPRGEWHSVFGVLSPDVLVPERYDALSSVDFNTSINAQAAFVLITRTSASTWTVVPGCVVRRASDLGRVQEPGSSRARTRRS